MDLKLKAVLLFVPFGDDECFALLQQTTKRLDQSLLLITLLPSKVTSAGSRHFACLPWTSKTIGGSNIHLVLDLVFVRRRHDLNFIRLGVKVKAACCWWFENEN